jgi:sortase A
MGGSKDEEAAPRFLSTLSMKIETLEHFLLAIGLILLATWCAVLLFRTTASWAAVEQFRTEETSRLDQDANSFLDPSSGSIVRFRVWSTKGIEAYKDSHSPKLDAPLAVLRIPKIGLEAPLFNGTDDLTLDHGLGRILGTVKVGEPGNLGIAGHRDGLFRGLKDLELGDVVELNRPGQLDRYVVSTIRIVNPDDVSVLASTPTQTLTLVTCYPFYYIGSAPRRYIVTASIQNWDLQNQRARGFQPPKHHR